MGRNGRVWISPPVAKQGFVGFSTVNAEEDIPLPSIDALALGTTVMVFLDGSVTKYWTFGQSV